MDSRTNKPLSTDKKQLKKYSLVLIGLLALGGLAWWAWQVSNQKNTLDTSDTEFAVADTAHINRIFISLKTGENYSLERSTNGWRANKSWPVSPTHIQMLLSAIRNLSIRRPVGKAERETVIRSLATSHIKVQVYALGEQARSYYIGQEADDHLGSYALMEGSEMPYVVHLAYFNGYLWPQFHVQPAWRNKQIFQTNASSFQKLKVEYLQKPDQSFSIERKGNVLVLDNQQPDKISSQRLGSYLPTLSLLNVGEFINSPKSLIDSLRAHRPQVRIMLTDRSHAKISLWIYDYRPDTQTSIGLIDEQNQVVSLQIPVFLNYLTTKSQLIGK